MAFTGKIAAPRAVREWQAMRQTGQRGTADVIAQGYGQLGLRPRFLENISTGGNEAAVDLRMGRAPGPEANHSGYVASKLYKPDSPITQGEHTTELLQQKQDYTNTARSISPEARSMMPAMYGHEVLQKEPGAPLRHVSHHEYVPDAGVRANVADVRQLEQHVYGPMQARGKHLADVPRLERRPGGGLGIGAMGRGNAAGGVDGPPKVIDFLPAGNDSVLYKVPVKDHVDSAYQRPEHMNPLRKDVYRPQPGPLSVQHPAAPDAATAATALPHTRPPGSAAPATLAGGAAPQAAGTLRAVASPPQTTRAALGVARTELAPVARSAPTALAGVARPGLRSAATAVTNFARRMPKIAAISDDEALASLDRLQAIEQAKPTPAQLGRYAVIGGVSGPVVGAMGDALGGRPVFGGGTAKARLRGALAGAATGALASGAVPLVRTHLDQEAEKKLLRGYVAQHEGSVPGPKVAMRRVRPRKAGPGIRQQYQRSDFAAPAKARLAGVDGRVGQQVSAQAVQSALGKLFGGGKEKDAGMWGGTPARRMGEDYPVDLVKAGFQTSAYDGGIGYPSAPQASQVPPLKAKSLKGVVEKEAAGAPTRGGFLMASNVPPPKAPLLDRVVEKKAQTTAEFCADFKGKLAELKGAAAELGESLEEARRTITEVRGSGIFSKGAGIATTPAGQLAKAQSVGKPRITAPAGPSIAQIAKPKGFGLPLPGATKSF